MWCDLHRQCCCTFHSRCTRPSVTVPAPLQLLEFGTRYHWRSRHCRHCRLSSMHWRQNCFADRTTMHTSGNSSIDTSLIRDIYCGPEVLFETCVAMKFVDDEDDMWPMYVTLCMCVCVVRSLSFGLRQCTVRVLSHDDAVLPRGLYEYFEFFTRVDL